jgi:hypothetical protein
MRLLTWFLRASAILFLSAALAVVMPTAWMASVYEAMDLGTFPDVPLMQYMTRSLSAFYAILGVNYLYMSLDVPRYLPLLRFSVPVTMAFTAVIIALDLWIPMPISWTLGEAVSLLGWTLALWWLLRRVPSEPEALAKDGAELR